MTKLRMLLAAALLSGSAGLLPATAHADTLRAGVSDGTLSIQYGERYQRGRLSVRPGEVEPGDRVTLIGRDLRPGMRLIVSAGRNPARLEDVQTVRADGAGRVFARVRVPDWARPGRNLFFALETPGGRVVALSRPVQVIDSGDNGDERISVTGELLAPTATCPRLAGDDGRVYALAGSLRDFDTGDRVRVTGELADVSTCNQRRTIDVERIRPAD